MIQANCMQIASGWAFDMTLNTSRYRYLRRGTVSQIFEVQPSAPFQQSLTGHLFQKVLCLRFHLFIHGLANLRAKQNHRMIYGYHCIEIIDRLILIVIPRAGWYWICWMPYIYMHINHMYNMYIYIYFSIERNKLQHTSHTHNWTLGLPSRKNAGSGMNSLILEDMHWNLLRMQEYHTVSWVPRQLVFIITSGAAAEVPMMAVWVLRINGNDWQRGVLVTSQLFYLWNKCITNVGRIIAWSWESQDIASKAHRQIPFFTCFHIERVTGSSVQGMPVSMPVSVV